MMDLLELVVISSFDLVSICAVVMVDGMGYAGWLVYLIVRPL
jgi:hypothetical protein